MTRLLAALLILPYWRAPIPPKATRLLSRIIAKLRRRKG